MNVAHGLIAVGAMVYLIVALTLWMNLWSAIANYIGLAMLLVLIGAGVFFVGAHQ